MEKEQTAEKIKKLIKALLEKLNIEGQLEILENSEETKFVIRTQEAGILIGENGQNLIALNHLIRRMSDHLLAGEVRIPFLIDVNDYQAKKIEELKAIARIGAQRVRYFKKAVLMKPMPAYERRIIHTALLEYPDIITESIGQEPKRQVVIKPYS